MFIPFNPFSKYFPFRDRTTNNRKRTKGRKIQEIKIGNRSKFIKHTY